MIFRDKGDIVKIDQTPQLWLVDTTSKLVSQRAALVVRNT